MLRCAPVVLGGDSPLGFALVLDLEKNGYIVITSVSTPEAVEVIEQQSNGYVRAIVLDPTEVCASLLSLRVRGLTSCFSLGPSPTSSARSHLP